MSNYTEYVFCPYCGGITAPGTCVNCGMPTSGDAAQPRTTSESAVASKTTPEFTVETKATPEFTAEPKATPEYSQYVEQEPPKKKRWWILLIIITVMIFLAVVVAIFGVIAAIAVSFFMANTSVATTTATAVTVPVVSEAAGVAEEDEEDLSEENSSEENSSEEDMAGTHIEADEFALDVYQRSFGRYDLSYIDLQAEWDEADFYADTTDGVTDMYLAEDYVSTFGSNHDNHSPDEFTGEYYEPFVDCIDDSYGYGLTRHYMEYNNYENNVQVYACIAYYEITGDVIPNQDALNEEIFRLTAHDLLAQSDGYTDYGWYSGQALILVDSFVTYNDGEKMSILLDVNISEDGISLAESYIYGINIDLVNGEIMDNDSILMADSDVAAVFRERCCAQNGTDIEGLNYIDDYELADFLGNSSTNIVFYTPYGMEYGYAYELSDGSKGWMTITLSDYEKYLQ